MKRLALIVSFVAFCGSASAQLSDIELKAAYCYGVASAQSEDTRKEIDATPNDSPQVKSTRLVIMGYIEERRIRFKDYLEAKGLLTSRATEGVLRAIKRGPPDVMACKNDLRNSYYRDCKVNCTDPEPCARVKKCLENFLPF